MVDTPDASPGIIDGRPPRVPGVGLEIDNVSMTFPRRNGVPLPVLQAVSFTVGYGEFVTLVGPSGTGKSTLLHIIAGLLQPAGGRIRRYGDRGSSPGRGDLAYMFQRDTLLPWATAAQNVALPMLARGRSDRARVGELLARVGLRGFENAYPHEMSGGMRKRVQLARLLAQAPKIVLMDEPFGALDAQTKILVQQEFLGIWEDERLTTLMVTHDLQEAIVMSDQVVLLSARPGTVIGTYRIDLARPRRPEFVVNEPRFGEIFREMWLALRAEVDKADPTSRHRGASPGGD